jgi:hypothetical protein
MARGSGVIGKRERERERERESGLCDGVIIRERLKEEEKATRLKQIETKKADTALPRGVKQNP